MFEIVFDSIRDDFTREDFEGCYGRHTTRLEEAADTAEICFTSNSHVDLNDVLRKGHFENVHELCGSLTDAFLKSYDHLRFLIAVPQDSVAARLCVKNNPAAQWGGVLGCHGFVYGNVTDQLILHETLHILGANDCYTFDDEGLHDATCGHPNCIMQHDPCNADLRSEEWICKRNVHSIRTSLKKCS